MDEDRARAGASPISSQDWAEFSTVIRPLIFRSICGLDLKFWSKLRDANGVYWPTTRTMAWVALALGPPLGGVTLLAKLGGHRRG